MKMPRTPPDFNKLLREVTKSENLSSVLFHSDSVTENEYLHWDKLRHLTPPDGISTREWWFAVKYGRRIAKRVPLDDLNERAFAYGLPDPIPERLHMIDKYAAGSIEVPEPIMNPDTRDRYLVNSLIEEAITSSQLEGAATTRPVAKEMIRTGRKPRDRSERMIVNNFITMQRITKVKEQPLTLDLLLDLQRTVTLGTLDNPGAAGRFRLPSEQIDIGDDDGNVFHTPPPAEQLEERVAKMLDFANGNTPDGFVHPVIRSIILHFWLAYDHPFVDGNGRTARALFYWSMLHNGFWLCEFISISEIIRRAQAKYGRAFLYTETDDNDLTYFILYHLEVIRKAIEQLREYMKRKMSRYRLLERKLRGLDRLNHRQRALVGHALRHPHQLYTIEWHERSHQVVYQTARTDLLDLADRELFTKRKIGREWNFAPAKDLEARLEKG